MKLFYFAPLLLLLGEVCTEKILIFHAMASYSHRVQTWPIAEALSRKGHEVSYIAPFNSKEPNPNITELVPQQLVDIINEMIEGDFDVSLRVEMKMQPMHEIIFELAHIVCERLLSSPEFQEWFKVNKKFDLFIIDSAFSECGLGLASQMGAKSIIFNTVVPFAYEYDGIGFLPQSASIPELEVYSPEVPMNFFGRLANTYLTLIWRVKHYFYTFKIDELLRKYFKNPELPHVGDLLRNTSLVLYTGDLISDYARSLPPLFVNVAGTHCKEGGPLPKELEKFISGDKYDGFIYISLGSVVIPANLPKRIKQIFFETIRAFPKLKFLWRWKGKMPKDIPDNLLLQTWFPQVDLLGHHKIKGFVTQSGRPSTLEAIYLGVPMISFPVLGDQDLNANRLSEMGATIKLEIGAVTTKQFTSAVEKVAYDKSVKERMMIVQKLFRDRPMPPVETGVWWIEYVLKYKDTEHLRPPGNEQYWFVRRQVDVWAFVSITLFSGVVAIIVVGRKVMSCMREGKLKSE